MKLFIASFFALTLFGRAPMALAEPKPVPKKGKFNTQLFENEGAGTTLTGKVKVVREIREETEVFLDNPKGPSGPYVLPQNIKNRAALLKILHNSQKPGGSSVTISIDEQQVIKSVEESESSTKTLDWGN